MSEPARRMLSFDLATAGAAWRFQFRTAGIAIRDGHVLACREDEDPYLLLPGGRVELGERSDEALLREIEEETGFTAELGPLAFSAENIFARDGIIFHELSRYYRVSLAPEFPFVTGAVALTRPDEGHILRFSWLPLEARALSEARLLPGWLQTRLPARGDNPEHLILDEREPTLG